MLASHFHFKEGYAKDAFQGCGVHANMETIRVKIWDLLLPTLSATCAAVILIINRVFEAKPKTRWQKKCSDACWLFR